MFRSYLIAAGAALLCTTATAQQQLPQSRMFPITTPIKNAGTLDPTTGKWTKPNQQVKSSNQTIFNNTCTWQTQGYYAGFDWCEDNYDEGRVPSTSDPLVPCGAEDSNNVLSIQVSYCTFVGSTVAAGGYDMTVGLYNKLNGDCVGFFPPTPPSITGSAAAYIQLAGMGLPGSTTLGYQACWLITIDTSNMGVTLLSDGEGTFDGVPADDKFIWTQRQNTTVGALNGILNAVTGLPAPDGFIITGEPASGGFGACSYNIPCGTDLVFGNTCGTGLDSFDASWINVDGIGQGASGIPAGCVNSVAQYGFGTNCYFFGGYPSNPLASYWLVMTSDGRCGGANSFCTQTKATSVAGCTALLTASDLTLATGSWDTTNIPRSITLAAGNTVGIYIYTNGVGNGQDPGILNTPFGTICLTNFTRSTAHCLPLLAPTLPGICNTSVLSLAVNCNNAGMGPLGISVGEDVNCQAWYRDGGGVVAGDANLSNAIWYTVQ